MTAEQVRHRAYYNSHKEELRQLAREYYKENKKNPNWVRENRARALAHWYVDKEESRLRHRLQYHNRGGYKPEEGRIDRVRMSCRARRVKMVEAGELTRELIQEVYEANIKRYGTLTCYLCLGAIQFGEDNLEHKTPVFRGGKNEFLNLDVAHATCNQAKGIRTYEEWKQCQCR